MTARDLMEKIAACISDDMHDYNLTALMLYKLIDRMEDLGYIDHDDQLELYGAVNRMTLK